MDADAESSGVERVEAGGFVHKTVPNDIAYHLVQQHPDQIEIVPTPNYIPEVDFRK